MATPVVKKPVGSDAAAAKPVVARSTATPAQKLDIKRDIAVAVIGQCTEQQLLTAPGKVISVIRKITDEVLA